MIVEAFFSLLFRSGGRRRPPGRPLGVGRAGAAGGRPGPRPRPGRRRPPGFAPTRASRGRPRGVRGARGAWVPRRRRRGAARLRRRSGRPRAPPPPPPWLFTRLHCGSLTSAAANRRLSLRRRRRCRRARHGSRD